MAGLINLVHVRQALELPDFDAARAREKMAPAPRGWRKHRDAPRQAAVLLLLYHNGHDGAGRLQIVLTLRQARLRGHGGQVSFPGGRREAQDSSLSATALRETGEEIGILPGTIRILGGMPPLYIPVSHHDVFPTVGYAASRPRFCANPREVAEVFSFALDNLLQPDFKREERRNMRGISVRVPYYPVGGHKVWGATAMILSELEGRLRQVLPQPLRD